MEDEMDRLQKEVYRLCRLKLFDDARAQCENVLARLETNQQRANVLGTLAYIESCRGNSREQVDLLEQAKSIDPRNRATFGALMDAYVEVGAYERAIDVANILIGLDKAFPFPSFTSTAYFRIAYANWCLHKFEEAEAALQQSTDDGSWIQRKMWSRAELGDLIRNKSVLPNRHQ